ncbi:MAG: hypothetical protein QM613_06585 [Micrococcaceae bacterium]
MLNREDLWAKSEEVNRKMWTIMTGYHPFEPDGDLLSLYLDFNSVNHLERDMYENDRLGVGKEKCAKALRIINRFDKYVQ